MLYVQEKKQATVHLQPPPYPILALTRSISLAQNRCPVMLTYPRIDWTWVFFLVFFLLFFFWFFFLVFFVEVCESPWARLVHADLTWTRHAQDGIWAFFWDTLIQVAQVVCCCSVMYTLDRSTDRLVPRASYSTLSYLTVPTAS